MRFACKSCGKAYNLQEERIAGRSNVKLKCRVCGAIVEVKEKGQIVAQLLPPEGKPPGRVSEAPTPLASTLPDGENGAEGAAENEEGPTIAIADAPLPNLPPAPLPNIPADVEPGLAEAAQANANASLSDSGASAALPAAEAPSLGAEVDVEPAAPEEAPPAAEAASELPSADGGPPPLVEAPSLDAPVPAVAAGFVNGAIGDSVAPAAAHAEEDVRPPIAPSLSEAMENQAARQPELSLNTTEEAPSSVGSSDTNKKLIAAFITGMLVDRLLSGLF